MKNSILALMLVAASLNAEPSEGVLTPSPVHRDLKTLSALPPQVPVQPKEGFFYLRFTAGEGNVAHAATPLPGFGLGYRHLAGDGAADISVSGIGISENRNSRYFWTAPKASYYHYLQPNQPKSFYLGGGLAWGGIRDRYWRGYDFSRDRQFVGIIPSGTLGYEFAHRASFLGFGELTVSQPALAVARRGAFPGPIAELSLGIGF